MSARHALGVFIIVVAALNVLLNSAWFLVQQKYKGQMSWATTMQGKSIKLFRVKWGERCVLELKFICGHTALWSNYKR